MKLDLGKPVNVRWGNLWAGLRGRLWGSLEDNLWDSLEERR